MKAKTEVVLAETLKKLGYVEYDGEIKDIIEDTGEKDEAEENISLLVKSDGIVLDNLKENMTDEEVRNILALKCPAEDLSDVTIHPLGSSKSKLIKDIKSSILQSIVNKVNGSVIDGTQVHCHLHVPVTPPKPNPETTTAHVEPVKDTLENP